MFTSGLIVAAYGVLMLGAHPSWMYSNYWGEFVFAPFVVIVGLALVALSPFRLEKNTDRARHREEKAVEFPHDAIERALEDPKDDGH